MIGCYSTNGITEVKGPLTCLDEIWYVVETHWKLHKITLKVVCAPSLGGKSLTSGKFVSEIRHFELWRHSSLLAYIYYIPQLTAAVRIEDNSRSKAAISIKKRCAISLCSWRVLTYFGRWSIDAQVIHRRVSPANGLKRHAYIARIGQGSPLSLDFTACVSPATATTGFFYYGFLPKHI